jgi:N-acetylglucosaminyldiphosphoundecaprenol N-acetyl-beta-D-mannosaminyltransferase
MRGLHVPADFSREVVCVLGLPFDVLRMDEAARRIRSAVHERRPLLLSTANLNFVIAARKDEAFRHSIIHSQMSLADGMPIVWVSRLLGLPIQERVPGSGLFERLQSSPAEHPVKVFFFGAPEGVAEAASKRVNQSKGGIVCVGFDAPAFVPVEAMSGASWTEPINTAAPDFLVVSLGAQKGQAWIERNRAEIKAPVISHLGAVVGFAAGALKRAPLRMQRLGLEWLWRIKEEPHLWRRYSGDAVAFAGLLLGHAVPLWWQRVWARTQGQGGSLRVDAAMQGLAFQLKLGGVCDATQLAPLRAAFADATSVNQKIVIDLAGLVRIDAAAMGMFLLLYGHQRDIGLPLEIVGLSAAMRRQFGYHCTEFLLQRSESSVPARAYLAEADSNLGT